MKKLIALSLVAMFAFVTVGCGDDDDSGSGSCTNEEIAACVKTSVECTAALDPTASDYKEKADKCKKDMCDCLDNEGCSDAQTKEVGCTE